MGLIKILKNLDKLFPKPPVDVDEKKIERKIVSRYSGGQISLCLGKYLTSEDIKKRKAKLSEYNFI